MNGLEVIGTIRIPTQYEDLDSDMNDGQEGSAQRPNGVPAPVKRKRRHIDAELLDYINTTAKRAAQLAVADIFQNIATQLQKAAAASAPPIQQVSFSGLFSPPPPLLTLCSLLININSPHMLLLHHHDLTRPFLAFPMLLSSTSQLHFPLQFHVLISTR